jgi:hypothetical protein
MYPLKPGYNAIWLSIDCSDRDIGTLITNTDIEEIWQWNASASTTQFTASPAVPMQADAQWLVWKRGNAGETTFSNLSANTACLIKVKDTAPATFDLTLIGKPVPPRYEWKSSGVNFVGFPMVDATKSFTNFFSLSPVLNQGPPIFYYNGGLLSQNPSRLVTANTKPVVLGHAYWVQTSDYTDFNGPIQVTTGILGLDFGDTGALATLRVRNVTDAALTVDMPVTSASPPDLPAVAGQVPLTLRGAILSGEREAGITRSVMNTITPSDLESIPIPDGGKVPRNPSSNLEDEDVPKDIRASHGEP